MGDEMLGLVDEGGEGVVRPASGMLRKTSKEALRSKPRGLGGGGPRGGGLATRSLAFVYASGWTWGVDLRIWSAQTMRGLLAAGGGEATAFARLSDHSCVCFTM